MNCIRTKVKLKVMHTLKEVQPVGFQQQSLIMTTSFSPYSPLYLSISKKYQSIIYSFSPSLKKRKKVSALYRSNKGGFACCTPLLTTYCKQKNDIPVPKKRMKLYPKQYKIEFFRNRNNIINYNSIIEL